MNQKPQNHTRSSPNRALMDSSGYSHIQHQPCPECHSPRTVHTLEGEQTDTFYCPDCGHIGRFRESRHRIVTRREVGWASLFVFAFAHRQLAKTVGRARRSGSERTPPGIYCRCLRWSPLRLTTYDAFAAVVRRNGPRRIVNITNMEVFVLPQRARGLEPQPLCSDRQHHTSARSAVVIARALSVNPAIRRCSIVAATTAGMFSVVRSTTAETKRTD